MRHEDENVGIDADLDAVEFRLDDTGDGVRPIVQPDGLSDDFGIGGKLATPVIVADHRHESDLGRPLVVRGQHAAEPGMYAKGRKERAGDLGAGGCFGFSLEADFQRVN